MIISIISVCPQYCEKWLFALSCLVYTYCVNSVQISETMQQLICHYNLFSQTMSKGHEQMKKLSECSVYIYCVNRVQISWNKISFKNCCI